MKVYFEDPKFYHYPLIRYYLSRHCTVYTFDFCRTMRKRKWLRGLVDTNRISNISPYVQGNDSLALDNVERVYSFMAKRSKLIDSTIRLYKDKDTELAFKKTLAKELSNFYAIQIILDGERKKMSSAEKIFLVSNKYFEMSKILTICNGFSYKLENIQVPFWSVAMDIVDRCFARLNNWMACLFSNLCLLGLILLKIPKLSYKKDTPGYKYAIAITNPGFQFRFSEYRTFDFLLDGAGIRKDNTIFLCLAPFDKAVLNKLTAGDYNLVDLNKKTVATSRNLILGRKGIAVFKNFFVYTLGNLLSPLFEYGFITRAGCALAYTYVFWNIIAHSLRLGHYIAFNDEGIIHIGRNIVLRHYGTKTWYYNHSNSFEFIMAINAADIPRTRHWLWSFLLYDYYVSWSRKIIDFQKIHQQRVARYYNTGCLWSEFIASAGSVYNLDSYLKKYDIKDKRRDGISNVVSFFETSFFDGIASQFPLKDGIKFYNDIVRLLNEEPELFILIKEKKRKFFYYNKASVQYSEDNRDYLAILEKLKGYPNCYIAEYNADPVDIIKASSLIVTYAFSSSTIEALGARKKAIFYDPLERFRGYSYDEIPDFVAHGYKELKYLIKKLLYDVTNEEYEEYLNREVLNKIEDYLDGNGLTRFRNLLSKS